MTSLLLALALVALLALNGFFVLAEFSIVKLRPSRVQEMAARGQRRATLLADIQAHLDEYLSVCQVGITLASVALGMVGEALAEPLMGGEDAGVGRYILAMTVSYVLISGSHIVLGELVPKSIAIRVAETAGLFSAVPLKIFHTVFFPALWLLTHLANAILRVFRVPLAGHGEAHSEDELRILLGESQEHGMMSFRRLLYMENVFDFGELVARDAMRPRDRVRVLDARQMWSRNLEVLRASRFTRLPLMTDDSGVPTGFIHVKDLVLTGDCDMPDLAAHQRPLVRVRETTPLESILSEMQRRRIHVALVSDDQGRWTGLLSLEDILEELVGTIRDEFEDEDPVRLSDALTVDRIRLDVEGASPIEAIEAALARLPTASLPLPAPLLLNALRTRGRITAAEVRDGIGMPQVRVIGLRRPFVMVLRSPGGIACVGGQEKARVLVVLLTPAGEPRVHHRLQTILGTLLQESEYVRDRLLHAETPEEVLEALVAGEQAALD